MMSYASRSAYEFTESPQSTPVRLTKPATPVPVEETTPSKAAALSSFFSSKWGSLTAKATEVAQRARGALHEYVASDSAINAANEIFALDLAYPPWENLGSIDESTAKELRQLIMNIAENPRHLLNVPPDEDPFTLDEWLPVAIAALKEDEKLREARASLVPKDLDEETFWRSYFFRVNLLKRAYGVSEAPQLKEGVQMPEPQKMRSSLASSASSLNGRDSASNLSASSSSADLPKIDELHFSDASDDSDGLVGESDEDQPFEPKILDYDVDRPTSQDDHSLTADFYDVEQDAQWQLHNDFSSPEPFHVAVPDHILKALED